MYTHVRRYNGFLVGVISVGLASAHPNNYFDQSFFSCRHLPVGVLFDLFGRGGSLPWNVTVHFKVRGVLSAVYRQYSENLYIHP